MRHHKKGLTLSIYRNFSARIFASFACLWVYGCSPQKSSTASTPSDANDSSANAMVGDGNDISAEPSQAAAAPSKDPSSTPSEKKTILRPSKIPRDRIDDRDFAIIKVAIAKQMFLESESLLVTYKLPLNADYVEMLRCKSNVIIDSGVESINLQDVEISGMADSERDAIYRSSNFFEAAERQEECELIATGTRDGAFVDSWAPTGQYRWLIRACVSPNRLTDQDKLSTRNCSRRVAISSVVSHTNARKEKEMEYLKKSNDVASQMDMLAQRMRWTAIAYNDEVQRCEDREYRRMVNFKKKEAILALVATATEVGLELRTAARVIDPKTGRTMGYAKHYRGAGGGPQGFMDLTMLLGALGGIMTTQMYTQLFVSTADMAKSCARGLSLEQELSKSAEDQVNLALFYGHFYQLAEFARLGQKVADGDDVTVPKVNTGAAQ